MVTEQLDNLSLRAKWHFEAWREGKTFDEIAAERTLIFRVEHVLLFHRTTNRWLLQLSANPSLGDDSDIVREIEEFGRDLIFAREMELEEFFVRDVHAWLIPSRHTYLAAVIRGNAPNEFGAELKRTIAEIETQFSGELNAFNGDSRPFAAAAPLLSRCLQERQNPIPPVPRFRFRLTNTHAAIVAATVLLVVAIWATIAIRDSLRWRSFVAQLKHEPGILIAKADRPWFGRARIAGLRDARSRDPAELARAAKLNPSRIEFDWRNYTADASAFIRPAASSAKSRGDGDAALQQFKNKFHPPDSVRAVIANHTLVLAGSAPYEWIVPVREEATKLPGITAINGDDLVIQFDPKLLVERFRQRFGVPDGADVTAQNSRLILSGEAPHAWLDQVRRGAMDVPGVRVLDDRNIIDVDQRAFLDAKSAIEGTTIVFVLNRDSIDTTGATALARVAAETQRCFAAAQNMSVNVKLELRGYGDAVATEVENADLSRRRADAVRNALIVAGIDAQRLESLGMGAPPPPEAGEKPGAGQFDRRVFFRVAIQP